MGTKHGSHERLKLMRNKIGLRIAQLRELKGLSQKQLSEQLAAHGLTVRRETVTQWENGTRKPSYEIAQEIANFFEVSTDYLLGESDIPKTLDEQLDGVEFALYGEVKDMTEAQKRDVLNFIKFLKSQEEK